MSVPNIVIDGTHFYGSYDISITTNGVPTTYIFDDISIDRPSEKATDDLSNGSPNRSRSTARQVTGRATLQIGTTLARPQHGDVFSQNFDSNYGVEYFYMDPVPFEASNAPGQIRKIQITFNKLNGGRTTVTTA